jgi:RNA polymerase sigma-70 factor, ECF subfamily
VEEGLDAYRAFRREQGDFEALFRGHYPEIVRYLTARLGSRDDALELASEVFTEAWRRVPGLQWRGRPVRAWLYRVAANMAADELKRRSRTVPLEDAVAPDASETAPDRIALTRALRTLPPDHQLVVHLRLVEGLPFAEVARVMNRNVGACQMLMLRAGKSLRALLAAEGVRDV